MDFMGGVRGQSPLLIVELVHFCPGSFLLPKTCPSWSQLQGLRIMSSFPMGQERYRSVLSLTGPPSFVTTLAAKLARSGLHAA